MPGALAQHQRRLPCGGERREHLRQARDSLSHSLQVILGTMIGSAEAAGPGREGHSRRVASVTRDLAEALGWPPPRMSLMASIAWMVPMMPGRTPSTPPS